MADLFDPRCERCPRLTAHLRDLRATYPDYFNAPVPAFGRLDARLLIVGLAPGMHGANATGRPFTGDYAGILLYRSLHAAGLASAPESVAANDGLELLDCRITNAVKCLPPQNKPTTAEANECNQFLQAELRRSGARVVLALGSIAHRAVLRALGIRLSAMPFAHGARHEIDARRILFDSYHCSRYNTQTRRLTQAMFIEVLTRARDESQAS
jgi:uracil-DNA glycosylase family 4